MAYMHVYACTHACVMQWHAHPYVMYEVVCMEYWNVLMEVG